MQPGTHVGAELARGAAARLERGETSDDLARRLAELSPVGGAAVRFASGRAEAVEAAWRMVRRFHLAAGEPQRRKAIARRDAFHGATLGALSFCGVDSLAEPLGPPAVPVRHVSSTAGAPLARALLDELEQAVIAEGPETVAMAIAEPVQLGGGCLVPPDGYWLGLREICDRYGILLVADEAVTAPGRLGEWFGVTRFGAVPDLVVLGDGLTGGAVPLGAVLAPARVAGQPGEDGPVAAYPLAAAVALEHIDRLVRDGVLAHVRVHEPRLRARLDELRRLPIVADVRGAGFLWAIELHAEDGDLPARLRRAGATASVDGTILTLTPPLTCDRGALDDLVDRVGAALDGLSSAPAPARGPATGPRPARAPR